MRDLQECQAEVFRRSEERIKARTRRRNRILTTCIPLLLCLVILGAAMLPGNPTADIAVPENAPEVIYGVSGSGELSESAEGALDGVVQEPGDGKEEEQGGSEMKKAWIWILAGVLLLAVLFTPIPGSSYDDGGTREYTALTYKIVDWNRITADSTYDATKVYCLPDNFKSVDELWAQEERYVVHSFVATILELNETSALVQPAVIAEELNSADRISFGIADLGDIGARVGSDVEIYYQGGIMETYPAQIKAVKWHIAGDLRHKNYPEIWLDKETAEKCADDFIGHVIIDKIYADCFFAYPVIPMPYTVKFNGQLGEDWCVGDQVICTYKNTYYDHENNRVETDLLTVEPSDWTPDPNACYKPVIYLYPEQEMDASVQLLLDGKLTCTYPAYNGSWEVKAAPDGTLTDSRGQTYNYLYWEGLTNARWDMTEGFCVKGEDTAAFLEQALEKLGLNRKEANEFIVYWLPLMEGNAYNVISFQTETYENAAKLQVEPAPDTVIRVFMTWQAAENYVNLEAQDLTAPARTGFTVVEWGGAEVK